MVICPDSTITDRKTVGLLFVDGGNAWNGIGDIDPFDLRHSFGLGLRILTSVPGVIEFDLGYGLDRREVDGQPAGTKAHFQFGPRFF